MNSRIQINQSLSADCVIFGFNGKSLKVLLIERREYRPDVAFDRMKLPGAMIRQNETLEDASKRILEEFTGLRNIALKQVGIFSDPDRVSKEELEWINEFHGTQSERVVTVGYYALVRLDQGILSKTTQKGAYWTDVDSVKHLAMDHMQILGAALEALCKEMIHSPVAFDLLPKKFTLRELQNVFEAVLGVEADKRNFRKKIISSGYLTPTGEKEQGVAHKPAEFYVFNRRAWQKQRRSGKLYLSFMDNWKY